MLETWLCHAVALWCEYEYGVKYLRTQYGLGFLITRITCVSVRSQISSSIIEWYHAVGLWLEYKYGPRYLITQLSHGPRYLITQLSHNWAWSPISHNSNDMSMSMVPDTIVMSRSSPVIVVKEWHPTARSSADETRNDHCNAKRNPNRNQEAIVLHLFSFAILERDVQ